jgi:hypothetical protein
MDWRGIVSCMYAWRGDNIIKEFKIDDTSHVYVAETIPSYSLIEEAARILTQEIELLYL